MPAVFLNAHSSHRTLAKISLSGSVKIMETLLKEIPEESIPQSLGGSFTSYNEPFEFDLSESGPFFLPSNLIIRTDDSTLTSNASLSTADGASLTTADGEAVEPEGDQTGRERKEVERVLHMVLAAVVIENSLRQKAAASQADNGDGEDANKESFNTERNAFLYTDIFSCDDCDAGPDRTPASFYPSGSFESPFTINPLMKKKLVMSNGGHSEHGMTRNPSSVELVYNALRQRRRRSTIGGGISQTKESQNLSDEVPEVNFGRSKETSVEKSNVRRLFPSPSRGIQDNGNTEYDDRHEELPTDAKERVGELCRRIQGDAWLLLCSLVEAYPLVSGSLTGCIVLFVCGHEMFAKVVFLLIMGYAITFGAS